MALRIALAAGAAVAAASFVTERPDMAAALAADGVQHVAAWTGTDLPVPASDRTRRVLQAAATGTTATLALAEHPGD